jgi:hypothetical protein
VSGGGRFLSPRTEGATQIFHKQVGYIK